MGEHKLVVVKWRAAFVGAVVVVVAEERIAVVTEERVAVLAEERMAVVAEKRQPVVE